MVQAPILITDTVLDIFPGWNGAGPASDSDTAWPHATSSHITLTSGEWSNPNVTSYVYDRDENFMMEYLREFQSKREFSSEGAIFDYPKLHVSICSSQWGNLRANNSSAPFSKASEVWGPENFERLLTIKEKYDTDCLYNRGRVFATSACVAKDLATTSL